MTPGRNGWSQPFKTERALGQGTMVGVDLDNDTGRECEEETRVTDDE